MQTFTCSCGNRLFFENSRCMRCQSETGFLPDRLLLVPIRSQDGKYWSCELVPQQRYRKCSNFNAQHICNWMIAEDDDNQFCVSCRLNKIIPDLGQPDNYRRWQRMERAKRRTLYNLFRIGLRIVDRKADPDNGLEFRFMEDVREYDPYTHELVRYQQIMTGHDAGTITINIQEADHSHREAVRENMNELYRTPVGHVRHEIGHYFWDKLISSSSQLARFRELFGDEREDYQGCLQHYYQNGPIIDWQEDFISAYASAHAWEDWAETWAHYLHISDTMETANDFGLSIEGRALLAPLNIGDGNNVTTPPKYLSESGFDEMLTDWMHLTILMNALNRSMGMRDAYPFAVSARVGDKLRFVHEVIAAEVARLAAPGINTSAGGAGPVYRGKPG
ncbi:MAG: putative zinc-binding metallopeptidase [Gammaproteobacteria bacterium]